MRVIVPKTSQAKMTGKNNKRSVRKLEIDLAICVLEMEQLPNIYQFSEN